MPTPSRFAGLSMEANATIRLMGVINVSPESFYKGSVRTTKRSIEQLAEQLTEEGADLIDLGAMSTAPYLTTHISEEEEIKRVSNAIRVVRRKTKLPLSVDTTRHRVAQAALNEGASIINDISGLKADPLMAKIAKKAAGVILMAHPSWSTQKLTSPIDDTNNIFKKILKTAQKAGIATSKIVLDPGIGFFRQTRLDWWAWDLTILKNLNDLICCGCPLLVGLSRKSFIGHILNDKNPKNRLSGSLAATAISVINGASFIRTHDVLETKRAVLVAQALRDLKTE